MDIMYNNTISAQIHGEEWKINMILEIVDCLNGLCENDFKFVDFKPVLIIRYLYHMIYQYQTFYII